MRMDADQRPDAIAIFVVQVEAAFPADMVVNAGFLHLEASGINEQVELVLFALEHWSLLGDLVDTLAIGVDEMDVGPVEGRQVIIIKARALAHEHIPWLE